MTKNTYTKPQLRSKKIEVSFFMGNRFLDSVGSSIVPAVFAQSSCASQSTAACNICGGGACNTGGGLCGDCQTNANSGNSGPSTDGNCNSGEAPGCEQCACP